jgi:hypothetical protein
LADESTEPDRPAVTTQTFKVAHINALNRKDYIQLALLFVLAAATRFYRLGDASFWADEVLTLRAASLPWSTLWVSAYDPTPPLYYSIIRLMMDVSTNEWWLRLPSALFGTLTILLVYLAARKIWDSRAAFTAALLLALSTSNIEYSQEGRAYALAGMCIALSFLGLASLNARWRQENSILTFSQFLSGGGALYGIGVLGALYSHNTAVFFWIAAQLFFLGWWLKHSHSSRTLLGCWFAINFLVLLIWLPWLLASLQMIDAGELSWLSQYDFQKVTRAWRRVNSLQISKPPALPVDVIIFSFALWGWLSLRKNGAMAITFLAMLACSSIVIWAYGFIGTPVFMNRTILWGSIFTFMLVGGGISQLPVLLGRLVLIGLVGVGLVGFHNYDKENRAEHTDWRSPAAIFNQQSRPDDILLFRTEWPASAFLHYLEKGNSDRRVLGWSCAVKRPLFGKIHPGDVYSAVAWSYQDPNWDGDIRTSGVWVIHNACPDKVNVTASDSWLAQNWTLADSYKFKQVSLHHWVPKRAASEHSTTKK